jgi:hypothetical protein
MRSPVDVVVISGEPSEKEMLISQEAAVLSLSVHNQVGAGNSGGKIDASAG